MKTYALCMSASVLALAWSGVAAAQPTSSPPPTDEAAASKDDQVEKVVVTAERRRTSLQTTPIAATVLTGEDLANKGVTNVDQLQFVSPGATVNNFGQGIDFNIRGIGKAEHNTQTTTGVITYRDGVADVPRLLHRRALLRHRARRNPARAARHLRRPERDRRRRLRHLEQPDHRRRLSRLHRGPGRQLQRLRPRKARSTCRSATTLAARVAFNGEIARQLLRHHGPLHRRRRREDAERPRRASVAADDAVSVLFKTDYNYLDFGAYPADPVRTAATERSVRYHGQREI